jgi:hypothetical protein
MKSNDRNEFIHTRVLPATKKIIKGFGETESPYKNLIQFIYNVLKQQSNDQEGQT